MAKWVLWSAPHIQQACRMPHPLPSTHSRRRSQHSSCFGARAIVYPTIFSACLIHFALIPANTLLPASAL